MKPPDYRLSEDWIDDEETQKLPSIRATSRVGTLEKELSLEAALEKIDTVETPGVGRTESTRQEVSPIETITTARMPAISNERPVEAIDTFKLPSISPLADQPTILTSTPQRITTSRGQALLLIGILSIIVLNAINLSYTQFIGPQGWAYALGGSTSSNNNLKNILHSTPTPAVRGTVRPQLTPQQYINFIMQHMTLDQKLGQMLIVQFVGPIYSPDLNTMISQYNVGAVLVFAANGNIVDKAQLKGLVQQMQSNATIPLAVAIDQEGGTVDRLKALDGPRPSAAKIGATNDPSQAMAAGLQDAQDLAFYGINLNLAPVVDVTNVYNSQLYSRTYGNNAQIVTTMAGAYLQGLQQSGKVVGTLKHFPGLGDVSVDPHNGVPYLSRSLSNLEAIDWAPYRTLIKQGNVYAVMVTHEIVQAVDSTKPSSLSYKLVTGILRNELGFQGVVMTDSLTMEGILAYYTQAQAAVLAIEAGTDLLMGATTPGTVAETIAGIKEAINAGEISQQRIDDSVRRILMMKYQMGLFSLPTN